MRDVWLALPGRHSMGRDGILLLDTARLRLVTIKERRMLHPFYFRQKYGLLFVYSSTVLLVFDLDPALRRIDAFELFICKKDFSRNFFHSLRISWDL